MNNTAEMEKNIQRTMPNNRKTKTDENTKYAKFIWKMA